jgi:hypothetical protein
MKVTFDIKKEDVQLSDIAAAYVYLRDKLEARGTRVFHDKQIKIEFTEAKLEKIKRSRL